MGPKSSIRRHTKKQLVFSVLFEPFWEPFGITFGTLGGLGRVFRDLQERFEAISGDTRFTRKLQGFWDIQEFLGRLFGPLGEPGSLKTTFRNTNKGTYEKHISNKISDLYPRGRVRP